MKNNPKDSFKDKDTADQEKDSFQQENKNKEHHAKGKRMVLSQKEYQELKAKAEEKDQIWAKYLRLYADMENSRKMWEKQRGELLAFGNFRLMREFTSVLDEIEAASLTLQKEDTEHTRGLGMIYKKIKDVLLKEGVSLIEAKGKQFDPHMHEALFFQEAEELPEHTVIDVIQQGYKYGDKVLRPAKVKVSVKPQDEEQADCKDSEEDNRENKINENDDVKKYRNEEEDNNG